MNDTPRTDAQEKYFNSLKNRWTPEQQSTYDFARQLERELNEANRQAVLYSKDTQNVMAQRDQLKAEVEDLKLNSFGAFATIERLKAELAEAIDKGAMAEVYKGRWHDMAREQYQFSRNCYRKIEDKSDLGALLRIQCEATIVNTRFHEMEKVQQ